MSNATLPLPMESNATKPFDLKTHNGIITIKNPVTGEHRTFSVHRIPDDSQWCPGKRVVGLLTGSNNQSDYMNFGFVNDDGSVYVWSSFYSQDAFRWFAKCLANPERYTNKVEFNFEGCCRRCNRTLTTPESVAKGIGPTCEGRELGQQVEQYEQYVD